jgi:hypothetical protein
MIMPSYSVLPESTLAPSQLGLKGLAGLGQICSDVDPNTGACIEYENFIGSTPVYSSTPAVYTSPPTTPSGSSSGLSPAVQAALIQGGFNLANIATIKPGTTLSPTGSISQQSAGYPIGTLGTSLTASGLSSMLPLIVVIAVAAMFMRGGGR